MNQDSEDVSQQARSANGGSTNADLRRDPPPRPVYTFDTPEEQEQVLEEQFAWAFRQGGYVRSWDPRVLCQMPLLSRLWGYDNHWYRLQLIQTIAQMSCEAGRRLSPAEVDLLAMHTSRGIVAASYDRPVAFGVTAFFLWRGAASFRMPFYQPQFVRLPHPQSTYSPFLSTIAWHGARTGAYGAVGCAAYFFLAERYRDYMVESFRREGLDHELGLKALVDDRKAYLKRLFANEPRIPREN